MPEPTKRPAKESEWDDTAAIIIRSLAKGLAVLVWWSLLFPMISIPTLMTLWVGLQFGVIFSVIPAMFSTLGLIAWAQTSPTSFNRWVTARIRSRWRGWRIYCLCWPETCALHGLTNRFDDRRLVPTLRSVTIGATRDVMTVGLLTGQSLADWQNKAPALAEAFRAHRVTIRSTRPGEIEITAHHGDALRNPVPLRRPVLTTPVNPTWIRVGVTESGTWWHVPVLGHHILVAGATGAGKGSLLWSLIAGLAPGIHAGWTQVVVVDPKGGMEFGRGSRLFSGFAYDNGNDTLALLRAVTQLMRRRAERLRGYTRLHVPSVEEPLVVVIIDEIASLTSYIGDRKARAEVEQLLGLLLSQGRAVGISIIAAVQDPSKDVLPIRQLFSIRVGMRITESSQTTMVLGTAARDAGAICDRIPTSMPGVGYVCQDGTAEPVRVRAFHVTDPDIDYLSSDFAS
jgi:DNA segregation ATPase FtsK/SpoIIIE, S-DNA-T family